MKKYQIRIELLSDLCVSNGGGYNSAVDTDICYDGYGFPYIPGKRLKGCLRECGIELVDWGKEIPIRKLFGDEGDEGAAFRVGNAYLENYEAMKAEIEEQAACPLYHPQNVLNQFSYIRTQTSMDYATGVVEKGMLRTMRVANKGLIFVADVEIEDKYKDALALCCITLRHIGLARTRGLGEVRAKLLPVNVEESTMMHVELCADANYLEYKIMVEEPVICKSVAGGEAKTLDYIEGNKVFGIIAGELKKKGRDVVDFLNKGELICSNAYIGEDGVRFTEVPACYYTIKNVKTEYIDKVYSNSEEEQDLQLNSMKHAYVSSGKNGLIKKNVDVEERYHHRRPEDKAIGRAVENNEKSGFYHMSSISPRQEFYGFIQGTTKQVKAAYECLQAEKEFFIGFSRNSEYGKVKIQIVKTENIQENQTVSGREFLVKLEAPTILYNDNAFYSVAITDLKDEVMKELGLEADAVESVDCYMKYITLGGYNVTWRSRKPIIEAFDKGTVLHFKLKKEASLDYKPHYFLGERVIEGYGETTIVPVNSAIGVGKKVVAKSIHVNQIEKFVVKNGSLLAVLAENFFHSYIDSKAIEAAQSFVKKINPGDDKEHLKGTINNMLSMCKESSDYEGIKISVKARYTKNNDVKTEKGKYAKAILEYVDGQTETLVAQFCQQYQLAWDDVSDKKKVYLKALLTALKYIFRQGGKGNE